MTPKVFGPGDAIFERATAQYVCSFIDHTGAAIDAGAITEILATLRPPGGAAINGRDAQSVLNLNGGALAVDGTFTLTLSTDDTVAVGSLGLQARVLTLEVTFDTGFLPHEVHFSIRQLDDIS